MSRGLSDVALRQLENRVKSEGGAVRKSNLLALILRLTAGLIIGACLVRPAAADAPTNNLISAPLVSPTAAWTYYGGATTHSNSVAAWTQTPPELAALSRSLGANRLSAAVYTQNVFDYVRNNIQTEFRFGLGKGARGALIDQSGTPFDQAELMVDLLRLGGVSASYQVGT